MRAGAEQKRRIRIAVGILAIFIVLCVRNIFDYSPTYDEPKFLVVGERIASGRAWGEEMETSYPNGQSFQSYFILDRAGDFVHAPLSFYTHGLLLKPFRFDSGKERLRWARVTMLMYSVALGALVFVWGSKLFGASGGTLALVMYCFNSNILAHSSLITTDIIHACFSLFLLYFFWRFTTEGKKRWIAASGVSLGLALLSKYSAVFWFLFLPLVGIALSVVHSIRKENVAEAASPCRKPLKFFAGIVTIFILAVLILNVGYGFRESFAPFGSSHYQSRLLAWLSGSPLTSWIPAPVPSPFMAGFDSQKYISEGGHPTFLAGMHSTKGWWYDYLACFLLKMPVAFWLIMAWAGIEILRLKDRRQWDAVLILSLSSLAIVGANSFLSNSHAGFRYVLTSVPPLFVLAGAAANVSTRWKKGALVALTCLYVAPALWIHPHHIAYFSELVGGPKNGYKWLSDSNLDWGQDLERAREYVGKSDVPIIVNPGMFPVAGRILINATTLQDCFATYDIHGWMLPFKPVDYVGYSWLVFDINRESVRNRERGPGQLPDEYYFGAFEYERNRLRSAERLARTTLAAHPGLPEGLYLLGMSRLALGELDGAAEAFDAVPASHPFYVDARANLSFIAAVRARKDASGTFWKQSMIEETLRAYAERPMLDAREYSELSAAGPHNWKLHNNLGVSLWAEGELAGAENELRTSLQLQPNFVEALSNLAIVLEEQGRYDEALAALQQYNAGLFQVRTMTYRDNRVFYGDTRVMFGDTLELYPKADENVLRLKAYMARQPTNVSILNQLAIALMRSGRLGEAYEVLSRALSLDPRSDALYTNLAVLYNEKKMFAQAVRACEEAVTINPRNSTAAELLSLLRTNLADSGKVEQVGNE